MKIKIRTPNNTLQEELDIINQILSINGEKYPFIIENVVLGSNTKKLPRGKGEVKKK